MQNFHFNNSSRNITLKSSINAFLRMFRSFLLTNKISFTLSMNYAKVNSLLSPWKNFTSISNHLSFIAPFFAILILIVLLHIDTRIFPHLLLGGCAGPLQSRFRKVVGVGKAWNMAVVAAPERPRRYWPIKITPSEWCVTYPAGISLWIETRICPSSARQRGSSVINAKNKIIKQLCGMGAWVEMHPEEAFVVQESKNGVHRDLNSTVKLVVKYFPSSS